MNYFKHLWIVAIAMLFGTHAMASDIDADHAMNIATRFFQSSHSGRRQAPANMGLRLVHAERSSARAGSVDYYVFNADNDQAFVIVAGDDRAERILAYGDHAIDMSKIPANVKAWLDQYKVQIEWLATHVADDTIGVAPPQLRAPAKVATIEPMVTARWSQDEPYFNQCPTYNGELCATGCVATAMAQVMYYWKYPAELPALPGYVTGYLCLDLPELPSVKVDWDNMIDSYNYNQYTDAQADAVATLMRYCGQGCFMEYTPEGSGASELEQLAAMTTFGYNPEAECLYRDDIKNDERWNSMLLEDLAAGRPILYCGTSWEGAHAFILDGYEDGLYHVNWGWGGYYDGYYALDALGKGDWEFNYYHSILYHLYPDEEGSLAPKYDFEQAGIYYKYDGDAVTVARRDAGMNSYSGDVVIPESVTHEGKTYPVTAIASNAFMNCLNLTSVMVPASIKSIGDFAFFNCRSLNTLRVHGTGMNIGNAAFMDCYDIKKLIVDDVASWCGVTLASYYSNPLFMGAMLCDRDGNPIENVVIPASVKKINDYAFTYCPGLRSVTFEEGVTSIGNYAFYWCEDLTSLTLPGSLRCIGEFAFGYSGIKSVVMPEGITSIGEAAFSDCGNLTHVDIPNTVTDIGYAAFCYCEGLTSVNLGQGVKNLDHYVFYDCSSLTSFTMPNSVTSIGYAVFAEDVALASVTLSDRLHSIPDGTFYECSSLAEVVMPQGITSIGEDAFYSAKSLTAISIPKSVVSIGSSAFRQCSKLDRVNITDLKGWCNITFGDQSANPLYLANHLYLDGEEVNDLSIPDGVNAIKDYAFSRCYSITSLEISDGVESIGDNAFSGCKNLASMNTGDGVRRIGEKAFSNCNKLADFTFGSRVDSVGQQAFASCTSLLQVTSRAITPPSMKGVATFADKTYNRATLRVPKQSVEDYQQALVWKRFTNIEGYNLMAILADVNGDGEVTIADVNAVIDIMTNGDRMLNGDVNGDGEVSIADVNAIIDAIVYGI